MYEDKLTERLNVYALHTQLSENIFYDNRNVGKEQNRSYGRN